MSTIRRSAAAVVAFAATGLSMAATPAMAATVAPSATMVSAVNPSNIDPTAATSLAIHKYLGAPVQGAANNGQPVSGITLPPLSGVAFDVYQVQGVDLTTNAGWAAATDLQGVTVTSDNIKSGTITGKSGTVYNLGPAKQVVTDGTGTATFNGTVGLFLVAENLKASTTITNTQTGATVAASSITPATPFVVTLPMTNPTNQTAWDYNLDVYPKNSSDSIKKEIVDQGTISTADGTTANADHSIDYKLTSTITPGITGTQMGAYAVADQLPKGTTYDSLKVTVTGSAGSVLTAGTDYVVWVNGTQTTAASPIDGPMVQVTMTQSGLDKLAAAKSADATAQVVVDLRAIATAAAGDLNNTAYLIPSNAWWQSQTNNPTATYNPGDGDTPGNDNGTPVTPGNPSNEVDTHLGTATLTKVDAAATSTKLAGAVFDLYAAVIDRADMNDPKPADCTNIVTDSSKLMMTGMTTDANGVLTMDGLQQSDYWNNTTQATQKIVYCLVETKAPTGYNLNAEPTAFFMTDLDTTAAVNVTAAPVVQDEKTNLANNLPLTGGAGAGLLSLGGLVVVGGTLAARAASKKRREDEADELA